MTWTNNQCDIFNQTVRQRIFNKKKLKRFEVGEILILNDFYNIPEMVEKDKEKKFRFYTSEQIRVKVVCKVNKIVNSLKGKISKTVKKMTTGMEIEEKYKQCLIKLNNANREYPSWKLLVERLGDDNSEYWIYVLDEESIIMIAEEKQKATKLISTLHKYYHNIYHEHAQLLDHEIIKSLWRMWSESFESPFANVNYGYCMTVHKSQGSTYHDVYIDLDDIFRNNNDNEAKRCAYTAITRTSNWTYLLI